MAGMSENQYYAVENYLEFLLFGVNCSVTCSYRYGNTSVLQVHTRITLFSLGPGEPKIGTLRQENGMWKKNNRA